ncbi:MAG: ACP S-malonyltransferase [Pseudohongiellaceae bacterium]
MNQALGFVFPGQGSQKPGMLTELAAEHPVIGNTFAEASEALSYNLWDLVKNDDGNELSRTSITQPAILTASVAIWRLWLVQGGQQPGLMAGHSLGEYSALVCSEVIAFPDAVKLVRKRGELMQNAVPAGVGGMAAIVGLDDDSVIKACGEAAQGQIVTAVNFNSPGQVVIAGHNDAVARAVELCKAAGAKRALPLPVSAPFHCELMRPAAENFAAELASVPLGQPRIPVIQNFGVQASTSTQQISANLVKQIYSPVPWVATIKRFAEQGITATLELGPGRVLSGLNKRIQPDMDCQAVNDPQGLAQALGRFSV